MKIDRDVLRDAAEHGVISPAQAEALWSRLAGARALATPPITPPVSWRLLASTLALAALTGLAAVSAYRAFGDLALAATAAAIGAVLVAAGRQRFQATRGARGQALLTAGLLLVPVVALGLVRAFHHGASPHGEGDLVDWMTGPWFAVELATFGACALGIAVFGIPILAWPLAAAAWFAAQDAAPLIFGPVPTWGDRVLVSALTGLVTLGAGLAVDRRARADYATWLYLPGLFGLCGALLTWREAGDAAVLLTLAMDVGLIGASLLLERRLFAVVGALGAAGAVGHLLDDRLDGAALVLALAVLGLGTLGCGVLYHQHTPQMAAALARRLPDRLRRWMPPGSPAHPRP